MRVLVPLAAPDASVVAQLAGQGARGPGQGAGQDAVQDAGGPGQGAGQPSPVGTQHPGGQEDVA